MSADVSAPPSDIDAILRFLGPLREFGAPAEGLFQDCARCRCQGPYPSEVTGNGKEARCVDRRRLCATPPSTAPCVILSP